MRSLGVQLKYLNPLADDYLYQFHQVKEFFNYNPYIPESYLTRYNYLMQKSPIDRGVVTDVLRKYNLELGAGPETFRNIELFSCSGAVAVITGQQAGLLGGPLYTIYKALTAVQLAKKLTKQLERPVVPIFWIAAEDHDFGEINHLHIWDREGLPLKLRLMSEPGGKYSIGNIPVPSEITGLLNELANHTPDTEFKTEILQSLASSGQSTNLADWFGRILVTWLTDLGLIFVNPMDDRLRQIEKELFKNALDNFTQVNKFLDEAGNALAAKGYPVAVEKEHDNVNLFMYQEQERLALIASGDGFILRGHEKDFTREEITKLIETDPSSFSPNVVLRPLVQELLFPTLAYIAGPGEISYFSQYKKIFELFGMEMPIIFPRANLTLVEGAVEKYLQKYQISLEDIIYRPEAVCGRYLNSKDEVGIDDIFENLCKEVSEAYSKAITAVKVIDSSLGNLGNENKERVISQINWLKSKTLQAHRKSNDVFNRQFRKLCNSLAPNRKLQERYIGSVYFLLKYGTMFVKDLSELDLTSNTFHKLVFLKK